MIDKSLNKIIIFQKLKKYRNTLAGQVTVAIGKHSVLAYTLPPLADGYTPCAEHHSTTPKDRMGLVRKGVLFPLGTLRQHSLSHA